MGTFPAVVIAEIVCFHLSYHKYLFCLSLHMPTQRVCVATLGSIASGGLWPKNVTDCNVSILFIIVGSDSVLFYF